MLLVPVWITPHAYLLNSACFWEEIMWRVPGTVLFASYSFSFCFNCRILRDAKEHWNHSQKLNIGHVESPNIIQNQGGFLEFSFKLRMAVYHFILPLVVASHISQHTDQCDCPGLQHYSWAERLQSTEMGKNYVHFYIDHPRIHAVIITINNYKTTW